MVADSIARNMGIGRGEEGRSVVWRYGERDIGVVRGGRVLGKNIRKWVVGCR